MLPHSVEYLLRRVLVQHDAVQLRLKVKHASLIYGFEIEDFYLGVGDKNNTNELLSFKRGKFSTFLPGLFVGEVSIRNLSLEEGRLRITQNDTSWNWGLLFTSDTSDEEEIEEEIEEESILFDDAGNIDLPFPVRLHAKIAFHNFSFDLQLEGTKSEENHLKDLHLNLQGVSFQIGILSGTHAHIPLGIDMMKLFETVVIAIELEENFSFNFQQNIHLSGNPKLKLYLFLENQNGQPEFHSRLFFDSKQVQMSQGNTKPVSLGFRLYYDLFYDTRSDRLLLRQFELSHEGSPWLNLRATVNSMSNPLRTLHLEMGNAYIELERLGRLWRGLAALARNPLRGEIRIAALSMFGSLDNLRLKSKLRASNLYLQIPAIGEKAHNVTKLLLDLDSQIDISNLLEVDEEKVQKGHLRQKPLVFGIFHYLKLPQLEISHEKAYMQAQAHITPGKGLQVDLQLNDCDLGYFTEKTVEGLVQLDAKLYSSLTFDKIHFNLEGYWDNAIYSIGRSSAEPLNLKLKSSGELLFEDSIKLELDKLALNIDNLLGSNVAKANGTAKLTFGDAKQGQVYKVLVNQLSINSDRLYPNLPRYLQGTLAPYRNYLANLGRKTLQLQLKQLNIHNKASNFLLNTEGRLLIPALQLENIDFSVNLEKDANAMVFHTIDLKSLRGALRASVRGKLEAKNEWRPNLDVHFNVFSKRFLRVHENISLEGGIQLIARMRPDAIEAQLSIRKLNLEFLRGNCKNLDATTCKSLFISDLELDSLKMKHNLDYNIDKKNRRDNLLVGDANKYQNKIYQKKDYNLRIGQIYSSHNPQGEYISNPKNRWHYVGHPELTSPGLRSVIYYHNNTLYIPNLVWKHYHLEGILPNNKSKKRKWVRNGLLQAHSIYFQFADGNATNMQAGAQLKVHSLNLQPFLLNTSSDYNGIVSANAQFNMNGLGSDMLEKMNALVNVHRISPEFGGFVTRMVMPTKIMALLVRNTLETPGIRFSLKDGLIYTYIQIQRGSIIPGILLSSENKELKQERIPIAQFLKQAGGRVKNIKEDMLRKRK